MTRVLHTIRVSCYITAITYVIAYMFGKHYEALLGSLTGTGVSCFVAFFWGNK